MTRFWRVIFLLKPAYATSIAPTGHASAASFTQSMFADTSDSFTDATPSTENTASQIDSQAPQPMQFSLIFTDMFFLLFLITVSHRKNII